MHVPILTAVPLHLEAVGRHALQYSMTVQLMEPAWHFSYVLVCRLDGLLLERSCLSLRLHRYETLEALLVDVAQRAWRQGSGPHKEHEHMFFSLIMWIL